VSQLLLLGSDCPGLFQLAVLLASGSILFYDLATYCVPGAAWQAGCCSVGCGHIGAVTTHVEVLFRCPPQDMIACTGSKPAAAVGAAATMPGSSQGVRQALSRTASGSSSTTQGWSAAPAAGAAAAAAATSGNAHTSPHHQHYSSLPQQQQGLGGSPCRLSQWSARPAGGGSVPLLLTGGADGSLRGWDLRLGSLGQPWMATHPHTGVWIQRAATNSVSKHVRLPVSVWPDAQGPTAAKGCLWLGVCVR
jgi:hypothetical protein